MLVKHGDHLVYGRVVERVEYLLSVLARGDEVGIAQHLQVVGSQVLRQVQGGQDFTDAMIAVPQNTQDLQPVFFSDHFQRGSERAEFGRDISTGTARGRHISTHIDIQTKAYYLKSSSGVKLSSIASKTIPWYK